MEAILHGLGICHDNHSHLDLMDLVLVTLGGGAWVVTLKLYYKTTIYIIKDFIKKSLKKLTF